MKTLITGSTGLLGGRIAYDLAKNGHDVILGSRQWINPKKWTTNFKLVEMDFTRESSLLDATKSVDAVIHLAGLNAGDCGKNPDEALRVNGEFTKNILEASIENKLSHFVYFSTAHVYRSPLEGQIKESDPVLNTHPYATSHLRGEEHVIKAQREKKINGIVLRLSNSFGSPIHPEANCWMLLVNDLCKQAATKQSLTLNSNGLQRRDFIPISDVAKSVQHLLSLPREILGNGLFNVGGNWSPRVIEVASLIAQRYEFITKTKVEISCAESAVSEKESVLRYDISKLEMTNYRTSGMDSVIVEIDNLIKFCLENFKVEL